MTLVSDHADRDLQSRVQRFLLDQNYSSLGQVAVEVDNGVVRLTGELSSFYEKQLALSCVRRVAEVRKIVDEIVVSS